MKKLTLLSNYQSISILIAILLIGCDAKKKIDHDSYGPQILNSWNMLVIDMAIQQDGLLTLKGVRTEALMHTAIHNAINLISNKYATYNSQLMKVDADPMAAAASAAYQVVLNQYPENEQQIAAELDKWLTQVPDGTLKSEGIELGKQAAEELINTRLTDNWNAD